MFYLSWSLLPVVAAVSFLVGWMLGKTYERRKWILALITKLKKDNKCESARSIGKEQ